jgi:hypothetical protein
VNALEVGIAFAPDELGCIERSHDVEKENSPTLNGLQHEVGDWPDISSFYSPGVVPVIEGHPSHEHKQYPKGDVAYDITNAHACE